MAMGVKKGARVGIWSPNNVKWLIVQLATAKIGAILVNINPAYRVPELEYALNQSGTSMLIFAPRSKYADYVAMVCELIPETRAKDKKIKSKRVPSLKTLILLEPADLPSAYTWDELMGVGRKVSQTRLEEAQAGLEFDEPINIQYTSGTTGAPKGATLTHHGILNNGFLTGEILRFTDQDRLCVPVPFYHCFGMVISNLLCLTHGATIVLPAARFDVEAVLRTIQDERCTAVHGVPTMFIRELAHPDFAKYDLSTLRTGIMAGAPCPIELMKKVVHKMGARQMTICYGMTETSPVTFQTRIEDPIEVRVSTVGRVHPHVEAKIINPETGRILPVGQAGELCVRGYVNMLGYWGRPDWTKSAIDERGWMHTGDIAVMNEAGYVNIVGRTKDMIARGGEKIFPREVEEVLYQHPKIVEAQVIGIPSREYGEEVMAWIQLKAGQTATVEEIRQFCKERMAYFKVPKYVKFVDSFPMTVTGKIQKFKMREISIREMGLEKVARIKTA
jgi:fatty-acyl-CoA synthase